MLPPSLSIDAGGFSAAGFGVTGIETAGQGNATKLWTGYFQPSSCSRAMIQQWGHRA